MDTIRIQTTQNVDIDYEVASVGDRILASMLDYLFFVVYFLLLMLLMWANNYNGENIAVMILAVLPIVFYDLLCEILFDGRSFGKMIMKIKVVKTDGTRVGVGSYLIRWVMRLIDTRLFTPGVALIAIVLNGRGQRIGDMAAGTTVIKMKQKVTLSDTILNTVRPEYTIVFPQVSRLSDSDIDIIKDVMRHSLVNGNQEAIALLAARTKQAMGVDVQMDNTQFLATVVQDYSQYTFDR